MKFSVFDSFGVAEETVFHWHTDTILDIEIIRFQSKLKRTGELATCMEMERERSHHTECMTCANSFWM